MKDNYNFYTDKLEGEYRTVFKDIETFGLAKDIDSITFNEKMSELLDIFISAQEDGKSVEAIVGKDMGNFCENYFSEISVKTHVYEFFDTLKNMAWFLLVIDILAMIATLGDEKPERSNFVAFMIYMLFIYIVSRLVGLGLRKWLYKVKALSSKARKAIFIIAQILVFVPAMILYMSFSDSFGTISPTIEAVVVGVYLVIYYIINRNRRKTHAVERKKFYDIVYDQFDEQIIEAYDKKNQKLMKRGKMQLSMEEYVQKLEKEMPMMEKIKILYIVLPVICSLGMTVGVRYFDGFETTFDMYYFMGILFIFECAVMIPLFLLFNNGTKARKQWLVEYRAKNTDEEGVSR